LKKELPNYDDDRTGTKSDARDLSKKALDIENRSFQIIDAEVRSHDYNELEWTIVRRVIHATADFDFAREARIIFRNDPIKSAFKAIRDGCTVITDVDMVLSGINKKSAAALGLKLACHISNKKVADKAQKYNRTRSEMAMRMAAEEMNSGIVVIGNAPTALSETITMTKDCVTNPALVVGIPVGFISASESKSELRKTDIPSITNKGRKGGSAAASSIINAIMLLYQAIHVTDR
jgi:precorrin-8X/cobalt-precorrin-8 methylmutase